MAIKKSLSNGVNSLIVNKEQFLASVLRIAKTAISKQFTAPQIWKLIMKTVRILVNWDSLRLSVQQDTLWLEEHLRVLTMDQSSFQIFQLRKIDVQDENARDIEESKQRPDQVEHANHGHLKNLGDIQILQKKSHMLG